MNPRVPPPIVVVVLGTAIWAVARYVKFGQVESNLLMPCAVVLLTAGLLLMIAAVGSFIAARTSINPLRPMRASRLITTGVFRFSRNPIYLGDLLLLAALAVVLGNAINLVWLGLFVCYINRYQIAPEERALTALFGEAYLQYCAKVRRWL